MRTPRCPRDRDQRAHGSSCPTIIGAMILSMQQGRQHPQHEPGAQHISSPDRVDFSVNDEMRTHRPTRSFRAALIASATGPPELMPSTWK